MAGWNRWFARSGEASPESYISVHEVGDEEEARALEDVAELGGNARRAYRIDEVPTLDGDVETVGYVYGDSDEPLSDGEIEEAVALDQGWMLQPVDPSQVTEDLDLSMTDRTYYARPLGPAPEDGIGFVEVARLDEDNVRYAYSAWTRTDPEDPASDYTVEEAGDRWEGSLFGDPGEILTSAAAELYGDELAQYEAAGAPTISNGPVHQLSATEFNNLYSASTLGDISPDVLDGIGFGAVREVRPQDVAAREPEIVIAITGRRPRDLYGYQDASRYQSLTDAIEQQLRDMSQGRPFELRTGGAQGADQCAFAAGQRIEGCTNHLYIPFEGQESKWRETGLFSQSDYRAMRDAADVVDVVSPGGYEAKKLQTRNEAMVNGADAVLAVTGDVDARGGTKNAIDYARANNVDVTVLDPVSLESAKLSDIEASNRERRGPDATIVVNEKFLHEGTRKDGTTWQMVSIPRGISVDGTDIGGYGAFLDKASSVERNGQWAVITFPGDADLSLSRRVTDQQELHARALSGLRGSDVRYDQMPMPARALEHALDSAREQWFSENRSGQTWSQRKVDIVSQAMQQQADYREAFSKAGNGPSAEVADAAEKAPAAQEAGPRKRTVTVNRDPEEIAHDRQQAILEARAASKYLGYEVPVKEVPLTKEVEISAKPKQPAKDNGETVKFSFNKNFTRPPQYSTRTGGRNDKAAKRPDGTYAGSWGLYSGTQIQGLDVSRWRVQFDNATEYAGKDGKPYLKVELPLNEPVTIRGYAPDPADKPGEAALFQEQLAAVQRLQGVPGSGIEKVSVHTGDRHYEGRSAEGGAVEHGYASQSETYTVVTLKVDAWALNDAMDQQRLEYQEGRDPRVATLDREARPIERTKDGIGDSTYVQVQQSVRVFEKNRLPMPPVGATAANENGPAERGRDGWYRDGVKVGTREGVGLTRNWRAENAAGAPSGGSPARGPEKEVGAPVKSVDEELDGPSHGSR